MYWPDYRLQKRRRRSWRAPAFVLALVIGFLLSDILNGWWQSPFSKEASRGELNSASTVETVEARPIEVVLPTSVPSSTAVPLKEATDFALPELFDETIILRRSDFQGRPLILNFWASWCVPCRQEMPALQRAYDTYQAKGLMVLGINETYVDDLKAAQAFATELGLTFPSVRDDSGKTSEELYRVIGLPTSVFVTPEGKVAYLQIGQMSDEQIRFYSSQLMAGEVISP